MRFNSAVLLFSSIVGHLNVNVLAVPIRIVVVEKVTLSDADAFLRSVRIGLPGANGLSDANKAGGDSNQIPGLPIFENLPLPIARPVVDPVAAIPMRPDAEYNVLPFPNPLFVESPTQAMREYCEKESQTWNARFGRVSNWVREMLGLPIVRNLSACPPRLFDMPMHDSSVHPPMPPPLPIELAKPCHNAAPANDLGFDPNASVATAITGARFRRPGTWAGTRYRPKSFSGRLQRALYSLSPWEGRALAFVVGCGLGVLVRMLYVFIILGARAIRSRNQAARLNEEEDEEPEQVVEGVILFDAGSIKAASQDDLTLYKEK